MAEAGLELRLIHLSCLTKAAVTDVYFHTWFRWLYFFVWLIGLLLGIEARALLMQNKSSTLVFTCSPMFLILNSSFYYFIASYFGILECQIQCHKIFLVGLVSSVLLFRFLVRFEVLEIYGER